jgi:hypothetical protein
LRHLFDSGGDACGVWSYELSALSKLKTEPDRRALDSPRKRKDAEISSVDWLSWFGWLVDLFSVAGHTTIINGEF